MTEAIREGNEMKKRMRLIDSAWTVQIEYFDPLTGEDVTRIFWVINDGGWVRECSRTMGTWDFDDRVVHERLGSSGTLWATPDNLAAVIRREYRRMRAQARREMDAMR